MNCQSAVDVPTGASGYSDDVPPKHADLAAAASADYRVGDSDRGTRLSASNASTSNSSYGERRASTSSDTAQQNVGHNHTYPLAPGQQQRARDRRRHDDDDDDDRASRSRDEKKAKDMRVRCHRVCIIAAQNTAQNNTLTHLTALFAGLPVWAGTRVKPIWILLKQETVSGSGISCTCLHLAPYR